MTDTVIAITWFVGLAGIANMLQYFFAVTYQKHWPIFVGLFLGVGVPGIYFTTTLNADVSFLQHLELV